MPRLKPPVHGRDHRPARSDPIPGIIVYDYENEGEWLSIDATDSIPGSPGYGVHITTESANDIFLEAGADNTSGYVRLSGSSVSIDGHGHGAVAGNVNISTEAGGAILLTPQGVFTVTPQSLPFAVLSTDANGTVKFRLDTSQKLEVQDHSGNPIFRITEAGDVHIKTGKTITADL